MKDQAWPHIGGGVILSGGGALIPGICEAAEQVFGKTARLADVPKCNDKKFIYNDQRDIVPYGLLQMSVCDYQVKVASSSEENHKMMPKQVLSNIFHALINW